MPSERRFAPHQEESLYHALENALYEVGLQLEMLNVPAPAREHLDALARLCRADFEKRFS
jgi:hypothetical protein